MSRRNHTLMIRFYRPLSDEEEDGLDDDDREFLTQHVCERCEAFGENVICHACAANVCEPCLARCCDKLSPVCSICKHVRKGAWTCPECQIHVCEECAPANRPPPGFDINGFCRSCLRLLRFEREASRLDGWPQDVYFAVCKRLKA